MPRSRRAVGAAKRHTVGAPANNAPKFFVWVGSPSLVGDPYNSNGNIVGITPAKHVEWATDRMIAGGGWIHSIQRLESMAAGGSQPQERYNGGIVSQPETDGYSWTREALEVRSDGLNFFQRCAAHGQTCYVAIYAANGKSARQSTPFVAWHDNTLWTELLADFRVFCQTLQAINDSVGSAVIRGVIIDNELYNYEPGVDGSWSQTYPGGGTAAVNRANIKLRGQQLAQVQVDELDVPGGPEMGCYQITITGGWWELIQYYRGFSSTAFAARANDSFYSGIASVSGISKVHLLDAAFYRDSYSPGDSSANDNDATKWANAGIFNLNGLLARFSTLFTDAERREAMRRMHIHNFVWPTAFRANDPQGGPETLARFTNMTRAAVEWSMGFHAVYASAVDDNAGELRDHGTFEPAWQSECVAAIADSAAPVVTITSPTTSPTYSTAATTVTVAGTATDDHAIWRVEWANAANSTSGSAVLTWVNDSAIAGTWDLLDSQKMPRKTSLGLVQWHMNWTADIVLALGDNLITVTAYDTYGNSHADTITVTAAPSYTYDFAGTGAWVGWTTFAGTVDLQSGKGRTQTSTTLYSSAGAYLNQALPQDYELTLNATITTVTAAEFYGSINVRAATTVFEAVHQALGWNIRFAGTATAGQGHLYKTDAAGNASPTGAIGPDIDFVQGSVLRVRVRVEGANIKVRYWKNAETEPPTAWGIDYTDATPPTGTYLSVGCRNGNNTSFDRWDWDDVVITAITPIGPTAPTDIALSDSSVPENASSPAAVGTFSTTDPNVGDTFTYTLVSGTGSTDNGSFTIVGDELRVGVADIGLAGSRSIRVRTTDQGGLFYEEAMTVTVSAAVDDGNFHWGFMVTQDGLTESTGNPPGNTAHIDALHSANVRNAFSSIPNTIYQCAKDHFGVYPTQYTPGVWDYTGARGGNAAGHCLDHAVALINTFRHATSHLMIQLYGIPGWQAGLAIGNDFTSASPNTLANEDLYAQDCALLAQRYNGTGGQPYVKYFPFWNECKGMDSYDATARAKNIRIYNKVYNAVKAVRPDAQVGGIYSKFISWEAGMGGAPTSNYGLSLPYTGGFVDARVLDLYYEFERDAVGWDFVAIDVWTGNDFHTGATFDGIGPGVTQYQQMKSKWPACLAWTRAMFPTVPIIITEAYPQGRPSNYTAGRGAGDTWTESTIEDWVVEILNDINPYGPGWWCAWGEEAEPPRPFEYETTGVATTLISKLIAYEASL